MQDQDVDILLRNGETEHSGLLAVMSMCGDLAKSVDKYTSKIKQQQQTIQEQAEYIRELKAQIATLRANSQNPTSVPIDNPSDKRLYDALLKIKPSIFHFSDWYFIERICYEKRLITFAHVNDHKAFIDKLQSWGIDVRKPKSTLNANHLNKGAHLDNLSRYPNWKLKDGTACPDKKISLVRRFLSFFLDEKE